MMSPKEFKDNHPDTFNNSVYTGLCSTGDTYLHMLVFDPNLDDSMKADYIIEALELGFKADVVNHLHNTPLEEAIKRNDKICIAALTEKKNILKGSNKPLNSAANTLSTSQNNKETKVLVLKNQLPEILEIYLRLIEANFDPEIYLRLIGANLDPILQMVPENLLALLSNPQDSTQTYEALKSYYNERDFLGVYKNRGSPMSKAIEAVMGDEYFTPPPNYKNG